jgi:hypothetical protein
VAITSVNDIASALSSQQRLPYAKTFTAPKAAGAFQGGWLATGFPAPGVAAPAYTAGSGYTCSRTTTGAFTQYTNAAVANYLARMTAMGSVRGTLILADRLWSCSGMGFANATYTVTTPGSLPARITDSGVGCEIWCEQFVAAGAASGTLTVNYLDTGGNAGAGVIPAVVSAPVIGQMQPVPLAAGDTGVSQIVSAVNSATWTSGSWGITILKRIVEIPISVIGGSSVLDWSQCLAAIPNDACLQLLWMAETTTAPTVSGTLSVIDK